MRKLISRDSIKFSNVTIRASKLILSQELPSYNANIFQRDIIDLLLMLIPSRLGPRCDFVAGCPSPTTFAHLDDARFNGHVAQQRGKQSSR